MSLVKDRVTLANQVLAELDDVYRGKLEFQIKGHNLYLATAKVCTLARLDSMGLYLHPKIKTYRLGLCGTENQFVSQVILWLYDRPRYSLSCLAYWVDEGIGSKQALKLLETYGYNNPAIQAVCGVSGL